MRKSRNSGIMVRRKNDKGKNRTEGSGENRKKSKSGGALSQQPQITPQLQTNHKLNQSVERPQPAGTTEAAEMSDVAQKIGKNAKSDSENTGSPTVVFNRNLSERKKRLLDASPIRDILSFDSRMVVAEPTLDKNEKSPEIGVGLDEKCCRGTPKGKSRQTLENSQKTSLVKSSVQDEGQRTQNQNRVKQAYHPSLTGKKLEKSGTNSGSHDKTQEDSVEVAQCDNTHEESFKINEKHKKSSNTTDAGVSIVEAIVHSSDDDDMDGEEKSVDQDQEGGTDKRTSKRRKILKPSSSRALLREREDKGGPISKRQNDPGLSESLESKKGGKKSKTRKGSKAKKGAEKHSAVQGREGDQNLTPGVIYLGHIPHGFYEKQIRGFFSQFGEVLRVRVSRSWRTGKSSGFAFVKFADKDVATIAAEAMNGYLMHGRRLTANYIPPEKVHKDTFKPRTIGARSIPISELERRNLLKRSRNPGKVTARCNGVRKTIEKKRARLAKLGIRYTFPAIANSGQPSNGQVI